MKKYLTPGWVAAFAALIAALGIVGIGIGQVIESGKDADRADVSNCRGRLAAHLGDAQVDRDIADNESSISLAASADVEIPPFVDVPGFGRLPVEVSPLPEALGELKRTELEMVRARDLRNDFEADPTAPCPLEAP